MNTNKKQIARLVVAGLALTAAASLACALTGCASDSAAKGNAAAVSSTMVTNAAIKPSVIYVTDFYLNPADISNKQMLPRDGIIARRLEQLRGTDPATVAHQLISALSQSIVKNLNKAGLKAEYRQNRNGALRAEFIPPDASFPKEGWMVGGWFARVDEGNRVEQATIGFGAGQEEVETQVVVSDLARGAEQPFLHMGSASGRNVMPGGLVMAANPYAMAVKFVLTRGATERDVKKQGEEIAGDLVRYINSGGKPANP